MAVSKLREDSRMKDRAKMDKKYLYTPPDEIHHSFSHDVGRKVFPCDKTSNTLPPMQTPPTSPELDTLPGFKTVTSLSARDAPLFPEQAQDQKLSQIPLFGHESSPSPPRSQTLPIAPVPSIERSEPNDVTRSNLGPSPPASTWAYPNNLNIKTGADASRYYQARMNELKGLKGFTLPAPHFTLPAPRNTVSRDRDWLSTHQLDKVSKPSGITKARATSKMMAKPKAATAASPERSSSPQKRSPPKRRTPKPRSRNDFSDAASQHAASAAKHKRAPPSKKVESVHVNWTELADFAPPTSTLDSNPKPLKAVWAGNSIDLTTDPDRAYCHPQELAVAATLRLSCAQYLTNKRKIFQSRLQYLKDGRNFTKTKAQDCCGIDVNKASQLWDAFNKVGWFEESWYHQYL